MPSSGATGTDYDYAKISNVTQEIAGSAYGYDRPGQLRWKAPSTPGVASTMVMAA